MMTFTRQEWQITQARTTDTGQRINLTKIKKRIKKLSDISKDQTPLTRRMVINTA